MAKEARAIMNGWGDSLTVEQQELLNEFIPYVEMKGLSFSEKIKTKMICNKMEILLVLAGPIFMKVVRRA